MSLATGIIGAVTGLAQVGVGIAKNAKANKMPLDAVDPQQNSFAQEILARSRSFQSGSAFTSARDSLDRTTASITDGLVSASGGASGSLASNLATMGESVATGFNDVMAAGYQQEQFYTGLASQLLSEIAQRKLQVQAFEKAQKKAEASTLISQGTANLFGGLEMLSGQNGLLSDNAPGDPMPKTSSGLLGPAPGVAFGLRQVAPMLGTSQQTISSALLGAAQQKYQSVAPGAMQSGFGMVTGLPVGAAVIAGQQQSAAANLMQGALGMITGLPVQ